MKAPDLNNYTIYGSVYSDMKDMIRHDPPSRPEGSCMVTNLEEGKTVQAIHNAIYLHEQQCPHSSTNVKEGTDGKR